MKYQQRSRNLGISVDSMRNRAANDRDRSWSLLYTDPDEPELIYDIQYVYGDVKTDEVLFKLESYVAWTDPYDNGIAMIYIDADQDQSTGADFDSYFGWGIGVDYFIVREGYEYDGLYIWDDTYKDFMWIDDLTTNIVEANSNETIVGVDGVQFDEFSAINFAMLAGSYIEDPDFVPDIGMGHITFEFAPSWLKLSSEDGVISAGSQKDITVTFDATDLFGGDYFANILVVSNDPANPEMSIPAHLSVTGIPIYSGLDSVDFGISYVGYENVTTFVIDNLGADVLEISDITSDDVQLSVSPTALSIPPVSSDTLFLVLLAETEGLFSATVNMTTNDPDASEVSASVQSSVLIAPDISVSPDAIDLTTDAGSEVSETMTIGNEGGSDLNYHINIFYEDGTRDEGGPDDFGYKWKDSNEPNGPDFDWIDASGGTVIYLSDDDYAMGIPLGFTFSYYGEEYGTINIMSNGWVSFTDFDSWFPEQVPDPNGYYFGVIAPFGGDLYPPDGVVRYKTIGAAPHRIFVV
ncbi:MAG: hypothetical protein IID16_13090 [Candidatus Marinimicrobia bacterium]|nr:hypothetical protein [Candidatus Neomarinimicrobiota bacterium]